MAKKSTKGLKERLDDLANAMGGSQKPSYTDVRSQLFEFSTVAKELENRESIRDAEAKLAALETEKSALQAAVRNLESHLQTAEAEIKRFREEKKQREADEADLPDVQFDILRRLPSENSGIPWTLPEISYMAGVPIDEAEIHIDRLERDRLITRTWGHSAHVWYRTIAGNKFVLAKRLATEEQKPQKRHKHADLVKDAQEMLLLIARSEEGIKEFELCSRCGAEAYMRLHALHNEVFVYSTMGPGGIHGGRILTLAAKGAEYLTERGLL
jgi:hypothetical protein